MATVLWEEGTSGTEALPSEPGLGVFLAYFDDRPGLEESLVRDLGVLEARVAPSEVPDVDWVERFREGFRPFTVGSFDIVPAWETPGPSLGHRLRLVIEPGLAFGTGTHETTRLCLAALEEHAARGPLGDVADIGCGSAILALAALRLGARRALGVEIDPEALPVARAHLRLNGLPVALVRGDGGRALREGAFDVVAANLTVGLLVERKAELARLRRPGAGVLLLSGLLATEAADVAFAYRPFGCVEERTLGEWALVVVR